MQIKNLIIISIISLVFFSCEKSITIDIPDEGRKLTLNSFFVKDSNMTVSLTQSRHILDGKYEFDSIENADISIFQNSSFIEKLTETSKGKYISSFILQSDNEYQIEVKTKTFPLIKSESYIPEKTKVISISANKTVDEYGSDRIKYNLKFKDNPDKENFYFIQITKYVKFYDWETGEEKNEFVLEKQYLYSDDPNTFQEWGIGEGLLVNDEFLNGKEYSLSFSSNSYSYYSDETINNDTTTYYLQFNSISKDYYNYYKTLAKHKEAQDEFFIEPTQVYNNIENGFGIFAGLSTDIDSVKVANN